MSSPLTKMSHGDWGTLGGMGGWGLCRPILGILIRPFLVDVPCVAFYPFNGLVFGEEGPAGVKDPPGVFFWAPGAGGRGNGPFAVHAQRCMGKGLEKWEPSRMPTNSALQELWFPGTRLTTIRPSGKTAEALEEGEGGVQCGSHPCRCNQAATLDLGRHTPLVRPPRQPQLLLATWSAHSKTR